MAEKAILTEACINRLKAKKESDSLTWLIVAKRLGITQNSLYRLLDQSRGPSAPVAIRLGVLLDMPAQDVFVRVDN